MLTRRKLGLGVAATALAACTKTGHEAQAVETKLSDQDWASISATEWQQLLTEQEFYVLRQEGTERPFTSPLNDEKRAGTFVCAGCELPLFKADHKFDSGTGWPSFFQAIDGALETKKDFKLVLPRTEYHCARCGGHQGHVFKDGPQPTGLRYCNNGIALDFVADA